MEHTQTCPACGTTNPLNRRSCQQCGQLFDLEPQPGEWPELQALPERDQLQQSLHAQPRFWEKPQVKFARFPTRRKFLAGILGSAAILGLGSPALAQLFQNVQLAFNIRNFPYDSYRNLLSMSFSYDLNLMAMSSVKVDGLLYLWDYQQQRMSTLPANPLIGRLAWSPDNKYLLCQTRRADQNKALDIWDVQARQKIRSVVHNDYTINDSNYLGVGSSINWSSDGSQIALLLMDSFVVMDTAQLMPLLTLGVSTNSEMFAWSPDSQKFALLVGQDTAWSVQIWNLQTRQMDTQVPFQGTRGDFPSMLVWSPDGARIAVLSRGQLQIIHMAESVSSYALDEPNDHGILAWSPDGKYLVVAVSFHSSLETGEDINALYPFGIWDVVAKKKVHSFGNSTLGDLPDALAWSRDSRHIITIAADYQQGNWYWL